jgi:hypothetical protein
MWLTSIWTARDNEIHIGHMRQRHPSIVTIRGLQLLYLRGQNMYSRKSQKFYAL